MARKLLLVTLLASPLCAGQIPVSQIPNAAAVWNFNESDGSVAYDSVGSFHGTVTGGIRTNGTVLGFGTSIRFTGTNGDGIVTADPLAVNLASAPKTFIVMYRPYQILAGQQYLMSQNDGTNANYLSITHRTIDNGTIDIQAGMNPGAGTTLTLTAPQRIFANQNVVVAVTASTECANGCAANGGLDEGVNVWMNGVVVASSVTKRWNGCSGNLGIGKNPAAVGSVATGEIAFAAVINGIPTKAQMKKIAQELLENDDSQEH